MTQAAAGNVVQGPGAGEAPVPGHITVRPTVQRTHARRRHIIVAVSFLALVLVPSLLVGGYLYLRAADQYASTVGFSVRTEDSATAIDSILGSTPLSSSSTADTDILYAFLQSQQLVADIDAALDLRAIWARPGAGWARGDPVFAFGGGTIEDLHDQWARMIDVRYDSATALLDIQVLAFDPDDAQAIAAEIFARSSAMINDLSAVARADAVAYAREELTSAETRLKEARLALSAFRNAAQVVDPTIETQTQSGLVSALEHELAQARIDRAILTEGGVREGSQNVVRLDRRIAVIEAQLDAERARIGGAAQSQATVADLVGEYEALQVDLEFAAQAFTAARANFDAAQADARRQTRYLAAHVTPTLAERADYPLRAMILGLVMLFLGLAWSVGVLVGYALRDRR